MAKFTFLGPGVSWAYAPGKEVKAGEEAELTAAQVAAAGVVGISLSSTPAKQVAKQKQAATQVEAPLAVDSAKPNTAPTE